MPIDTLEQLKEHVELAIAIEMSTIPPYLYAMYSLEDHESEAALLLRSIVAEEMLHAALATNLLLALGGNPDFEGTKYIPRYPSLMPHHKPPLTLGLVPISENSLRDVFMRIEQPELHGAPSEPDEYETLGQFYHAIEEALEQLDATHEIFSNPQTVRQMSDHRFYRPVEFDAEDSGGLAAISNLATAEAAIEVIIHQGEGLSDDRWADPGHQELTHYHKLLQIAEGDSPLGAVRNLPHNPRSSDYPDPLRKVNDLFNGIYRGLSLVMARIFEGEDSQPRAVGVLYILMADVLAQLGRFLVSQPLEDGFMAAPTFEVYEFASDDRVDEMVSLAHEVSAEFGELTPVYDALRGLSFII